MADVANLGFRLNQVRSEAGQLRFVQRGDKRILQQHWKIFTTYEDGRTDGEYEWRDVPLVNEEGMPAAAVAFSQNKTLGDVNQTIAHGLIGRANTSFKEFSSKEMVYPEQD